MEKSLNWILTNFNKADMILYLKSYPEEFENAINLAITDIKYYSWRAAWLLWSCMDNNDRRIHKYMDKIIQILPERKDDHQRELMIILEKMKLNEEQEGILFNHCSYVWQSVDKKPSVRYNAFKMLIKITGNHTDLKNEITALTHERYLNSLSLNVRKSISKMIDSLI